MTLKKTRSKRREMVAVMSPLDPSDPRSWDHPCHEEQWLALARAVGRTMASKEFDSQEKKDLD
jgi:hypothetical protein